MIEEEKIISDFIDALLSVDRIRTSEILTKIHNENLDLSLIENIIVQALRIIGDGWEEGRYSLAQIYMSGVICEDLIDRFVILSNSKIKKSPKLAIGVFMDRHSLGKRIVSSIIKSSGYELVDFGQGLEVDDIVNLTIDQNIEILLISTLMLPSALKIKLVTEKLAMSGRDIKIIVGGAPFRFDKELWQKVGATADGKNATDIIRILESVVKGNYE
jgi:methanogenic corrinoid protein MtbC1